LNNKTSEQAFTIQYSSKAKGLLPGLLKSKILDYTVKVN